MAGTLLMPRPKQNPPLDTMVRVRMTGPDLDRVRARAEAAGKSVSDWMRLRLAGDDGVEMPATKKPTPRRGRKRGREFTQADPALVAEVQKIGNNLNQIAKWANTYKAAASAVEIVAHLAIIEEQLQPLLFPTAQSPDPEGSSDAH